MIQPDIMGGSIMAEDIHPGAEAVRFEFRSMTVEGKVSVKFGFRKVVVKRQKRTVPTVLVCAMMEEQIRTITCGM
jgi:hypothetical protein